jgi:hypothetical protein
MRRNGTYWREILEQASQFNQLKLQFIGPRRELQIRNVINFVPTCRYGLGMLVLRGEIGTSDGTRWMQKIK